MGLGSLNKIPCQYSLYLSLSLARARALSHMSNCTHTSLPLLSCSLSPPLSPPLPSAPLSVSSLCDIQDLLRFCNTKHVLCLSVWKLRSLLEFTSPACDSAWASHTTLMCTPHHHTADLVQRSAVNRLRFHMAAGSMAAGAQKTPVPHQRLPVRVQLRAPRDPAAWHRPCLQSLVCVCVRARACVCVCVHVLKRHLRVCHIYWACMCPWWTLCLILHSQTPVLRDWNKCCQPLNGHLRAATAAENTTRAPATTQWQSPSTEVKPLQTLQEPAITRPDDQRSVAFENAARPHGLRLQPHSAALPLAKRRRRIGDQG